jgi:hypothetical protein
MITESGNEVMSRLVIRKGANEAQEVVLKPGANRLGRNEQNDLKINDPTVSSFHCEIDFQNNTVLVRDLGSTNGTFINSVPIRQAILEPGQTLTLGSVDLFFPADVPGTAPTVPPPRAAIAQVRVAGAGAPPPAPCPSVAVETAPAEPSRGPDDCRNHAGVGATLICQQCGMLFCKGCVKTIHAGNQDVSSCLLCGGICVNLAQHRKAVARERATFGSLLPTAFRYPLQQDGPVILLCGTILLAFLDFARLILVKVIAFLGIFLGLAFLIPLVLTLVMSAGYLFAYMQNIISATAAGNDSPPGWPQISGFWDDVVVPCLRYITILALWLGPGFVILPASTPLGALLMLLGLFCVPMAFLTVSLADSIAGLNPLLIFSSITKVPGPYLIACAFFLVVVGVGTFCVSFFKLTPIFVLPAVVGKFVSLYGLTVEMRILGLLYCTNKEKLSWFDQG